MTQPLAVPPAGPALPEGARSEGATFEIVGGVATAEEIAALTAVLAAMTAAAGERAAVPAASGRARVSGWAERSRLVRRPLTHAPNGWRASARQQLAAVEIRYQ